MRVKHISVSVDRPASAVYEFISDLSTFPEWAAELGRSFELIGPLEGVAQTNSGAATIRFCEPNELGVLDYAVSRVGKKTWVSRLRALPNGTGTELIATLFQTSDTSDAYFERNENTIIKELTLKRLLEERIRP